ncbi:hypothetical protein [Veillonella sp.]|uniref:hypothetical protein n=1 Tax=Veillonella sp. TaxID=1926307 RepID=UPI0035A0505D
MKINKKEKVIASLLTMGYITFGVMADIQAALPAAGIPTEGDYIAVKVDGKTAGEVTVVKDSLGVDHNYVAQWVTDRMYNVREGYTLYAGDDKRHPLAQTSNLLRAYKSSSTADSQNLVYANQATITATNVKTLNNKYLNKGAVGAFGGGVNSNAYRPSYNSGFVIESQGKWIDVEEKPKAWQHPVADYLHPVTVEADGRITYKGKVVPNNALYAVRKWKEGKGWQPMLAVFTATPNGDEPYLGNVFGLNNEILMTAKAADGKFYSYWGTEVDDPSAPIKNLTVSQFNTLMHEMKENDLKLHEDDLSKVELGSIANGGTVELATNGGAKIPGKMSITGAGGTNGQNTSIKFQNTVKGATKSFNVDTGAVVRANNGMAYTPDMNLQEITINGKTYKVVGTDYQLIDNDGGAYSVNNGEVVLRVQDGTNQATRKLITIKGAAAADGSNLVLKYVGNNGSKGQQTLDTELALKGKSQELTTTASNGRVTFGLSQEIKDKLNGTCLIQTKSSMPKLL